MAKSTTGILIAFAIVLALVFLASNSEQRGHQGHSHGHHGHHHEAPHGGTLVVLGNEFAHIEMLLNQTNGALKIYFFDSHVQGSVRVKAKDVSMTLDTGKEKIPLTLNAQANELTGETVGNSSEFLVQSDKLKGLSHFAVTMGAFTVKGVSFKNIKFKFPEGNEDHSGHAH